VIVGGGNTQPVSRLAGTYNVGIVVVVVVVVVVSRGSTDVLGACLRLHLHGLPVPPSCTIPPLPHSLPSSQAGSSVSNRTTWQPASRCKWYNHGRVVWLSAPSKITSRVVLGARSLPLAGCLIAPLSEVIRVEGDLSLSLSSTNTTLLQTPITYSPTHTMVVPIGING